MVGHELEDVKTVYEEICRSHGGIVDFRLDSTLVDRR